MAKRKINKKTEFIIKRKLCFLFFMETNTLKKSINVMRFFQICLFSHNIHWFLFSHAVILKTLKVSFFNQTCKVTSKKSFFAYKEKIWGSPDGGLTGGTKKMFNKALSQ